MPDISLPHGSGPIQHLPIAEWHALLTAFRLTLADWLYSLSWPGRLICQNLKCYSAAHELGAVFNLRLMSCPVAFIT